MNLPKKSRGGLDAATDVLKDMLQQGLKSQLELDQTRATEAPTLPPPPLPPPHPMVDLPPPPLGRSAIERAGLNIRRRVGKNSDPNFSRLNAIITRETRYRADALLVQMARGGAKTDLSDLIEAGLVKIVADLEAGLAGDDRLDAWDALEDIAQFLDQALRAQVFPAEWATRASILLELARKA